MTDRELMQEVLEALQAVREAPASKDEIQRAWIVSDLLRRRLAQPEQERNFCSRCGKRLGSNDWDVHTCTPPRPEQEPVAWMNPSWANPDTRGWASESFKSAQIDGWTPLYTTPPQRKPLTDEEIAAGRRAPWGRGLSLDAFKAGVRFAEASHGVKGKA